MTDAWISPCFRVYNALEKWFVCASVDHLRCRRACAGEAVVQWRGQRGAGRQGPEERVGAGHVRAGRRQQAEAGERARLRLAAGDIGDGAQE